jgi:hypothetical protein
MGLAGVVHPMLYISSWQQQSDLDLQLRMKTEEVFMRYSWIQYYVKHVQIRFMCTALIKPFFVITATVLRVLL